MRACSSSSPTIEWGPGGSVSASPAKDGSSELSALGLGIDGLGVAVNDEMDTAVGYHRADLRLLEHVVPLRRVRLDRHHDSALVVDHVAHQ